MDFKTKNITPLEEKVFVTQPLLPDLDKYVFALKRLWDNKHITNMGQNHNELEEKLKDVLKVSNLSLFNNGTTALLVALKALDLPEKSEVITTPFTFAATPHSITWNNLTPVFCDIELDTMTIDPKKIERLITSKTSAILGVHVYGFPCKVKEIDKIAKKYNLKVIYDAAHAFSTEIENEGIGNFGDITMFSFHATKLFNTIEGGCLTYRDEELKNKVEKLRNFGIIDENRVESIGVNGKMNEFQAIMGLENLKIFREEQNKRAILKSFYDLNLSGIKGIIIPQMPKETTNSYQYYPIIVDKDYSITRDELYEKLKEHGIYARKYFYPTCNDYDCYLDSTKTYFVTDYLKTKVLCLPYYGNLSKSQAKKICDILKSYS